MLNSLNLEERGPLAFLKSAKAGPHTLVLRYAAGAGDAVRVITINGSVAVSNLNFAGTSSWASYNTVNIPCNLPQGLSTVRIGFDSTQKSSNWLNIDNLVVTGDPPEQIRIVGLEFAGTGTVHLTWTAVPGNTYRVQYSAGLTNGGWVDLGIPITASSVTAAADDSALSGQGRYYRVVTP